MPPELAEKVGLLVVHSFGCTASFTQVINVLPSNLIIVSSSSIIRKWVWRGKHFLRNNQHPLLQHHTTMLLHTHHISPHSLDYSQQQSLRSNRNLTFTWKQWLMTIASGETWWSPDWIRSTGWDALSQLEPSMRSSTSPHSAYRQQSLQPGS